MIDYTKKPSNQQQMPLVQGFELMEKAKEWIEEHPVEWTYYLQVAQKESIYGKCSPNYVVEITRHRCRVSIRNELAAPLARIALKENPKLKFRLSKSKCDGFCEVVL